MGRLTHKTQRQPGPSDSTPPRNTPRADAIPAIAPQTPSAFSRSPPVNVVVTIESAAGSIIAAPTPCARRAPTRTLALPASPPLSEENANTRIPATRTRRRPSRSAARPPSSMKPP